MTITLFQAVRPPLALLLCGSEGSMHCALSCSYDCPTQTLTRESVLPVDTRVLDKMALIGRIRLGLEKVSLDTTSMYPMYTFMNIDASLTLRYTAQLYALRFMQSWEGEALTPQSISGGGEGRNKTAPLSCRTSSGDLLCRTSDMA